MTCATALTCSRYADGALPPAAAAALEQHLAECATCRARVAAYADERHAIGTALRAAEPTGRVAPFVPHPIIPGPLVWLCFAGLAAWAVGTAWLSLASAASTPPWVGWLVPDLGAAGIALAIRWLVALINGTSAPPGDWVTVAPIVFTAIGVLVASWLARRASDRTRHLCLSLGLLLVLVTGAPAGHAFELRRDEDRVTVPADETIDDTLVVSAENVLIEGNVTGDLIALGERVSVRGHVGGTLVVMAEELRLDGEVAHNVLGGAETVEIGPARLGGNVYAMGRTITLGSDTVVAGNAALAANEAEVHGNVGRDLLSLAEHLWLYGSVANNLRAFGKEADLADGARVGGDLTARLKSADDLRVASGATVAGETLVSTWPEEPNKYLTARFYLGEVLKLLAAFVSGLVLYYGFPALRRAQLDNTAEVLTVAAIGAIVLLATPLAAIAVALTLIGLPLGIVAFLGWLVALYAASIVTAEVVGRRLLDGGSTLVRTLLLGLAILFVLVNVPFLGRLVQAVVLVIGLGVMTQTLRSYWSGRTAA